MGGRTPRARPGGEPDQERTAAVARTPAEGPTTAGDDDMGAQCDMRRDATDAGGSQPAERHGTGRHGTGHPGLLDRHRMRCHRVRRRQRQRLVPGQLGHHLGEQVDQPYV
ncbi:hypothetical protein BBK14_03610 [Parafrankia soli]|uniref:Uncharacterized protein n=1 Tax=Parafrankia soli TaxID=2599596 RepID=A0A1S1Q503_9ACTN|nr:hypothetical protein [Parafrankia soli]OHV28255.1 hypothetical protein BBK14_03610 [Parafrankia soli]